MPDLAFRKSSRLLTSHDFQRVFQNAKFKVSHRHLLILAIPSIGTGPRLGLVIAKKNIRHAVQRNRAKRRIRETFRLLQHTLPSIDAIVLARSQLDTLSDAALTDLLNQQWKKLSAQVTKQDSPAQTTTQSTTS